MYYDVNTAGNREARLLTPAHHRRADVAGDGDSEIKGQELQLAGTGLDPGESAVAAADAMGWQDAATQMTTVFGNGAADQGGGCIVGGPGGDRAAYTVAGRAYDRAEDAVFTPRAQVGPVR